MASEAGHGWADELPRGTSRAHPVVLAAEALLRALEAEWARLFLWVPVLFSVGIVTYFALYDEPSVRLILACLAGAIGIALAVRRLPFGIVLGSALLAIALGFAAAKLRTELVRAPILVKETGFVAVTGWVEKSERRPDGRQRLTLRVIHIEGLAAADMPFRVRITLKQQDQRLQAGTAIMLKALLKPPPDPVLPHGFDFGRLAWYAKIGGVGFVVGTPKPVEASQPPLELRFRAAIDRLRAGVTQRIRAALPGEEGEIAAALITGERGGVPEEAQKAMRESGLAHILAISGLHMVIMAGTFFWLVRASLALVTRLALNYPIRKWAAIAALAAATFYLVLSGAAVPTIRAWIMMSIMLLAVLLDRPAITMRNVALAALLILAFTPEALFSPSFQMSFAAVVALVALYEGSAYRLSRSFQDVSIVWRGAHALWLALFGIALTTLVAGVAVAPFAAYHFHRLAHYGVLANLIAMPLVSLLIMPMALLALLVMPLGLEALPLALMGFGIELLRAAGKWVSGLPGAVSAVPAIPGSAVLLMALGGLWLCLWRTRWRAFGLVIGALGLALSTTGHDHPDILIDRDGRSAAIRAEDGDLALAPDAETAFSAGIWLRADGDARDAEAASANGAYVCDELGCIARVKDKTIALVKHPGALEEDCRKADIVIAPFSIGSRACTPA